MANLPSPSQVSGKYSAIYDAYLKQIDPKSTGTIEAMVAAKFLKKSGLSDVVLSRIWDLSDPTGRGYLDKEGLYIALKLVALAQAGHDINMRNIFLETPHPPKVGDIPKIIPPKIQTVPPTNTDWSIKPADRAKYEQLFETLQPSEGLLPGNKVRGVLMDSKLPLDTLSKIWDLADQDKDGSLDKHEFLVAMHLVYQALDKKAIPSSLPNELQRPPPSRQSFSSDGGFVANFPTDIAPPPVPPLPMAMPPAIPPMTRAAPLIPSMDLISTDLLSSPPHVTPAADWVVSIQDKLRFDAMFLRSDLDRDGLVSGNEIKDVFLQSGIPNLCLAQIWALCDTDQSGKLTMEQFALAMWMVERKRNGIEPPDVLTANMIPPSQRTSNDLIGGLDDNLMQAAIEPAQPTYSNPELEMISKEIEELAKERRLLENDVTQKEADIRIKSGEVRSLQSELDTLAATLKQLENQKGEAQKRLDDLKNQKEWVGDSVTSVIQNIKVTLLEVNKIRDQCQKQEETIREQEGELDSKRGELQKLKDEEMALTKEYDSNRNELEVLSRNLQDTQLQISQVKAMVSELVESQRQMNDALLICKSAIDTNDPSLVPDYSLKLEPDFRNARTTLDPKEEPSEVHEASNNGFGHTSAFDDDKFSSNAFASDQFGGKMSAGFDDSFNAPGFDDSFGSSFKAKTADPFAASTSDPFGDKRDLKAVTPDPNKDDFGSDPFAILHAPTSAGQILSPSAQKSGPPPRPESPSPALPPKKAKQPPPRPAPPRPMQGPTPTRPEPPSQGFGASPAGAGGFADFADFETKTTTTIIPTTTIVPTTRAAAPSSKTVATDFSEDPFKDYRYEDPFSIKDPFADDDSDEDQFAAPPKMAAFSLNNNNNPPAPSLSSPKNQIKLNKDNSLLENKNTKTTNGDHKPTIPKDSNSFANFEDEFISNSSNTDQNTDFFAAFNDNFNKNKNDNAFDDAFGDCKTITDTVNTKLTNKIAATFSADFNDNFDDEFSKIKIINNNQANKKSSPFPSTSPGFAKFDAFNDSSSSDSGWIQSVKHDNLNDKKLATTKASNGDNGFAAFVDMKTSKKTEIVNEQFRKDYSKADTFDDDLKSALQRSLVDQ